jgi:hypothetical protein
VVSTGQGGRAHGDPHWDAQLLNGDHVSVGPDDNINDILKNNAAGSAGWRDIFC